VVCASPCLEVRKMPDPPKVAGAQVAVTATVDVKILSELTVLTQELQKQILSLQSEAKQQRDKFEWLQKDVSDKISEQSNKFELLQRDVSELTFDGKSSEASVAMAKDVVPDKYGALRPKVLHTGSRMDRIKSALSPSRSRSPSPKKGLRPVFNDADEIQTFVSTSDPPSRNVSPTRRIEKRLGTKLLGDMTNLVDAQVQNLELRIATMESQFGNWRQAAVPDDAVKGLSSVDLQMLSGLKVVKSRNCMTLGCKGCQGCSKFRAPVSSAEADDPSPCSSSSGENEGQGKRAKKELSQKKASRWNLWFLKSKQKVNQATRPNSA